MPILSVSVQYQYPIHSCIHDWESDVREKAKSFLFLFFLFFFFHQKNKQEETKKKKITEKKTNPSLPYNNEWVGLTKDKGVCDNMGALMFFKHYPPETTWAFSMYPSSS